VTVEEIQRAILDVVPSSTFVAAVDVVSDLSRRLDVPAKQIWPILVMMTFDGVLVGEKQKTAEGKAMVRRATQTGAAQ
jgi:hypothetical protein